MPNDRAFARRSSLILPVNRPKFVASAHLRGADSLVLDLEDSVPPAEKQAARAALREAVPAAGAAGADVFIRVNKPFEMLVADLDAAVPARPCGLTLPKVESAEEVRILDALVAERELAGGLPPGAIEFHILVETCRGLINAPEIAAASARNSSLSLGIEDLATELEIDPAGPYFDVTWAHARVLVAARAAGIAPYGLLHGLANFSDLEALARDIAASRQFGYVGASCIHPNQVAPINEGFAPSAADIAKAERVIAAYEQAEREGTAAVAVDGQMVDVPVVERARRVLRRAGRLANASKT